MAKGISRLGLSVLALICAAPLMYSGTAIAANNIGQNANYKIADNDLAKFDHKAALTKQLGATHMVITEGLPLAKWEMDNDDPYPMWLVHHASILKIFPPKDIAPYVDAAYAREVANVVQQRCKVLAKYGLRGVWNANEPAVMPEALFNAHPEWRGPRIDQANRSRKAYFAPNVDNEDMLRNYRESVQALLDTCPEVDVFTWVTTDAGSGFDWSPSLYPGQNGNSKYKERPLSDRVAGFLINIQNAAKAKGHDISINLTPIPPRQWMIPTFSPDVLENLIRKLPRGIAIQSREGGDGRPFDTTAITGGSSNPFYPITGLSVPLMSISVPPKPANRIIINLGNENVTDFNFRLLKSTGLIPAKTIVERDENLRKFAISEVGEEQADKLMDAWASLAGVQQDLSVLDFGGMLRFGHVLNRWITRPMVPNPELLSDDEKKDYRRFLFQAKGEAQASDLSDIQAMQMYKGYGAHLLFERAIEVTMPKAKNALMQFEAIANSPKGKDSRYIAQSINRIKALICLLQSADNMVAYQALLDNAKATDPKPEANPVLGVQSSWNRTAMIDIARKEIDTMTELRTLLENSPEPLIDMAPTPQEETIMHLGPDLDRQIKHKIDIMNAHWRDYDTIFTVPNP